MINSASILNCDLLALGDDIRQLIEGGAEFLHIDIIDGHYVSNLGFPPRVVSDIKEHYPDVTIDVHMMVDDPAAYISEMSERGADFFCFHIDSTKFILRTLSSIQKAGMKAGVVLNPSQRVDIIVPFISKVDMVIMMTVEPGFPGQPFVDGGIERISELSSLRMQHNASFMISVDGGVDYIVGKKCKEAGSDIIVATKYTVFNQPEGIISACRRFKRELG